MFLQSGARDGHTPTHAVVNTFAWYATMLTDPKAQIVFNGSWPTGHVLPTTAADGFDGPGACLAHIYGRLARPAAAPVAANLHQFDQAPYTTAGAGWAATGLVYVPTACADGRNACKLHLSLHDCGTRAAPELPPPTAMSQEEEVFAAYAESNGVVLLMPRLRQSPSGALRGAVDVERGCWDVFGQLGSSYSHQSGPHLRPLLPMLQALGASNSTVAVAPSAGGVQQATPPAQPQRRGVPRAATDWPVRQLPTLNIDPGRIAAQGASSGGDMAVQFQIGFSEHVTGLCGQDAQPWRCAATRFTGDVLLPQTPESSTPHCFGCPSNTTILYDHCKSHALFVNTTTLTAAAAAVPACARGGGSDCIDSTSNLTRSKIFLARGECRTYTGNAVINTRDVYAGLGAQAIRYFDECNPDGSHRKNDTVLMCLEHVFGQRNQSAPLELQHNYLFPQAPFVTDHNVGFGEYGFMYIPKVCESGDTPCGLQVRFHGCFGATPADPETQAFAESNGVVIINPNVPGGLNGNNASARCNAGTAVAGNCKEIARGCWDGYGQLSRAYYLQSAAHMQSVWRMVAHVAGIPSRHGQA